MKHKFLGLWLLLGAGAYFAYVYLVKPMGVKQNAVGPATSAVINGQRVFVTPPGQTAVVAPDGSVWNTTVKNLRDFLQSFMQPGDNVAAQGGTATAVQAISPGVAADNRVSSQLSTGFSPTGTGIDYRPGVVTNAANVVTPENLPLADTHPIVDNPRSGLSQVRDWIPTVKRWVGIDANGDRIIYNRVSSSAQGFEDDVNPVNVGIKGNIMENSYNEIL